MDNRQHPNVVALTEALQQWPAWSRHGREPVELPNPSAQRCTAPAGEEFDAAPWASVYASRQTEVGPWAWIVWPGNPNRHPVGRGYQCATPAEAIAAADAALDTYLEAVELYEEAIDEWITELDGGA